MKNKIIIGLVLVLSSAGYFGYDYYMTKVPVAVKVRSWNGYQSVERSYPINEIVSVGKSLELRNGSRSPIASRFYLVNRKGEIIDSAKDNGSDMILPYITN